MKSKILDAVHHTATGLHKFGAITDVTMREFDKLCLQPVHILQPAQIKRLREKAKIGQAVFAAYLNTSVSTVQKWEIGEKKTSGAALKLLNIVERSRITHRITGSCINTSVNHLGRNSLRPPQ